MNVNPRSSPGSEPPGSSNSWSRRRVSLRNEGQSSESRQQIAGLEFQPDAARNALVDELIAQGWGNTQPEKIPGDWRNRRGPDGSTDPSRSKDRYRRPSKEEKEREHVEALERNLARQRRFAGYQRRAK